MSQALSINPASLRIVIPTAPLFATANTCAGTKLAVRDEVGVVEQPENQNRGRQLEVRQARGTERSRVKDRKVESARCKAAPAEGEGEPRGNGSRGDNDRISEATQLTYSKSPEDCVGIQPSIESAKVQRPERMLFPLRNGFESSTVNDGADIKRVASSGWVVCA
jgi:hypothetical protein